MAEHKPRRASKLGNDLPFAPPEPHSDAIAIKTDSPPEQPPPQPRKPKPPQHSRKRLKVKDVSPDDRVAFNCKIPRGLRQALKRCSADMEVDMQDIVAAALSLYLRQRNYRISDQKSDVGQ